MTSWFKLAGGAKINMFGGGGVNINMNAEGEGGGITTASSPKWDPGRKILAIKNVKQMAKI